MSDKDSKKACNPVIAFVGATTSYGSLLTLSGYIGQVWANAKNNGGKWIFSLKHPNNRDFLSTWLPICFIGAALTDGRKIYKQVRQQNEKDEVGRCTSANDPNLCRIASSKTYKPQKDAISVGAPSQVR